MLNTRKKPHLDQNSEVTEQVAHKRCVVSVLEGFQDATGESPEQSGLLPDPTVGFYLGRTLD